MVLQVAVVPSVSPPGVTLVLLFAGAVLLLMTGFVTDLSEGRRQISDAVIGGSALSKFQAMMEAQGVASETARALCSAHIDYFSVLRKSEHQIDLETQTDGNIFLRLELIFFFLNEL